jgi:transposase InsO family protein
MRQEKANYSITRMARLLKVSRSGYYRWADQQDTKARGLDPKDLWQRELDEKILKYWNDSDQTYGAPRITIDLHAEGIAVNRKTVAKAMRRLGIEGISPRSWVPVTTLPGKPTHSIPDRVKRLFDTGELNRVWLSDITYLRTGEGWLYLCVVRDGCSRRVLGWAMDSTQTTDLVERALRMAHTLRGEVPEGLVFHADRGTQFTSDQLFQVCRELGIDQSMGRTGVCFDNAMAESFWSTLKTEFYDRRKWKTRDAARQAVARWIEIFYNRRRRHSSIGNQSPVDFENAYHQAATPADENAA